MSNCIFLDTHVTEDKNQIMPENNWSAPFAGKDDVATLPDGIVPVKKFAASILLNAIINIR